MSVEAVVEEHDWSSEYRNFEGCDDAMQGKNFDEGMDFMSQEALSVDADGGLSMEQIEDEFCEGLEMAFQEDEIESKETRSLVVGQAEANHVGY